MALPSFHLKNNNCRTAVLKCHIELSYFDVASMASFYQFTLYMAIRLAHHSFTLGELGLTTFGACILFWEALHLTIARVSVMEIFYDQFVSSSCILLFLISIKIWPITTPYIKTFRLPTPLLVFQLALIPGSILIGFLLSPLLYLSRHIAQRPLRKLRFPEEKQIHRRFLALGFYLGAALIAGGLIGLWTRWCLGGRDPWTWAIFWTLEGRKKWTRPLLLAYWGALACVSVAGWGRQLSRSRKFRQKTSLPPVAVMNADTATQPSSTPSVAGSSMNTASSQPEPTTAHGSTPSMSTAYNPLGLPLMLPAFPSLPNGANVSVSTVATDLLDAADKRMPTLSLNARRKFFHALAVIMFVPGITLDVSSNVTATNYV